MKTGCIILFCYILSGCTEIPLPTVHEQLRQHILEAELGSAITISFAKKPAIPLPSLQNETTLIHQLKSSSRETRWAAAEQLSYSANKEVVLALIDAMRDTSGTLRICVMAQALGHLKDPRALSALTQAAFDPYNRDLRLCAIRSIGMIGDKSAVPDLIFALKQNNTPINSSRKQGSFLYAVFGYIGNTGDIKKLEAIRDKDKKNARVITESLQLIKKQDIKG